ncbi:MAG: serine--tRNA ligase, partial [Oscillatoriales cyanobacterium SM2_2_1]|nr:serine--tRNA ligase [Oscillatoriales cyanobacterium SM2_2_1]
MLDLRALRADPDSVQARLNTRGGPYDLSPILERDRLIRELETHRSRIQAESNEIGKQVGLSMRDPAAASDIATLKIRAQAIKQELADLEPQEREWRSQLQALLLDLPNLPHPTTPLGPDESA